MKIGQHTMGKKVISLMLCGVLLSTPIVGLIQPAEGAVLSTVASGTSVFSNEKAKIDASNTKDGYVMVAYTGTVTKIKVRITGPSGVAYNYNLRTDGQYEVFPLSDGTGKYTVGVYEHTTGNKYATAYSTTLNVVSMNEYGPFLRPNQYVNFSSSSKAVSVATELVKDKKTDLEKVQAIYDYIITTLTYDKEKAATVQSGYLPDIDKALAEKKGICFDYAALMTAMLRSQNIPAKLLIGYTGDVYHAWISTYTKEQGWVEGVIYFDGTTWRLMDPTFASSAKSSENIMEYIGNGNNYSEKYAY